MTATCFGNKHIIVGKSVDNCVVSCELDIIFFKEWMTAALLVRKTDNLLRRMHDCN